MPPIKAITGQKVLVDAEDHDLGQVPCFVNSRGYVIMVMGETLLQRLHRVVMARILNRELEDGEMPDHVNGDKLDNRRCNLRLATGSQNNFNRGRNRNNTTGFKGVYRNSGSAVKPFVAKITVNYEAQYLGSFPTAIQAAQAYDAAAIKAAGEFARLNRVKPTC